MFDQTITAAEVEAAQKGWCNGLLAISSSYYRQGPAAARLKAAAVLDGGYGYGIGPVAFKPTMAKGDSTFRPSRAGALDYFVGPDPAFPAGKGFATYKHWQRCSVRNNVIQLFGSTANTMGFVTVSDDQGSSATVEKTWTFLKLGPGDIRIVLHHSSVPVDAR